MALAVEPDDVNFKTQLDKESLDLAKRELHEEEKDRVTAVQYLRNLVCQEKWLRTPTDFLRARKFSQLLAKETLEHYWTTKTWFPEMCTDLDPADFKLQAIMRTGFYFAHKKRDKQERRLVIEQYGDRKMNDVMEKFGANNLFRTIVLVCDWLNRDEYVQLNGIVALIDCTDMAIKGFEFLRCLREISLPGRLKGLYMYNEPPFFDAICGLFKPLFREKTLNRMFLHGSRNRANVYDSIDMSMLPVEYLPDDYEGPNAVTVDQIVEEMIQDMMQPEFRNYILEVSSSKYGVDLNRKKQRTRTVTSFRKLNID